MRPNHFTWQRLIPALLFVVGSLSTALAQDQKTTAPTAPGAPAPAAMTTELKADVLKGLEKIVTTRCFVPGVDFAKWPTFLETHRAEIDKAETENAFSREVNRTLREFGVSHIRLMTPRIATSRKEGTTSGLGMTVKKVDAGLEVTSLLPEGPAAKGGIEIGDIIKEADGKPAADSEVIRVEPGKTLAVKVAKKTGELKDVTLENKVFSNRRPETLTWIADDAAVLKIWTFSRGYDRQNIEKLLGEVQDKHAKYLIIDLRSNGGGAVNNLQHFLSLLAPDSTAVGAFVGRGVADKYAKEKGDSASDPIKIAEWNPEKFKTRRRTQPPYTGRIAVLINRGSASASEICAAGLRDTREAIIAGSKSAGAVLASVYGSLPGGFEIQYPIQDYVTIKGMRLEGNPIQPDLAIEPMDDAAAKTLDALKKKDAAGKFSLR